MLNQPLEDEEFAAQFRKLVRIKQPMRGMHFTSWANTIVGPEDELPIDEDRGTLALRFPAAGILHLTIYKKMNARRPAGMSRSPDGDEFMVYDWVPEKSYLKAFPFLDRDDLDFFVNDQEGNGAIITSEEYGEIVADAYLGREGVGSLYGNLYARTGVVDPETDLSIYDRDWTNEQWVTRGEDTGIGNEPSVEEPID